MHSQEQRLITKVRNSNDNVRINRQKHKSKKTEMGRKTIVWIFQVRNWRNFIQNDPDIAKKGNHRERNESFNCSTNYSYKDQNENW